MTIGADDGIIPTATDRNSAQQLWSSAQEELRFQLARPSYETWLATATLVESDSQRFVIGVPTRLARDWVSERFVSVIQEVLSGLLGHECQVEITIDPTASPPRDEPAPSADFDLAPETGPRPAGEFRLNPNFTFSSFVVGNSSRFAHAACRAVADAPGKAYNPLFLYGGVGLGKTHLMHAIGHAVREGHRRSPKVAYITSEKFTNEMITAIQENKTNDFRHRYRTVDVLLIDDIQFLAGKDRTQEEFFHTFNALHEIQKQIVVSSDRPPKDIPTLEDRLRAASRAAYGRHPAPGRRDPPGHPQDQAGPAQPSGSGRGLHLHRAPDPEEHPRAGGRPHQRLPCIHRRPSHHPGDGPAHPQRHHPGRPTPASASPSSRTRLPTTTASPSRR